MDRKNPYEKGKIVKAATNKVITNVYMDSFPIEKVRFQNAEFQGDKRAINCYVDFSTMSRFAADVANGRIYKLIEEDKYGRYTVCMGGNKDGNNGKPLSRMMYIAVSGDKVFINMQEGPGKLSETGAIMPDGQPTTKIGVGIDKEVFREMILYTHDFVCAYLGPLSAKLVREIEEDRKNKDNQ